MTRSLSELRPIPRRGLSGDEAGGGAEALRRAARDLFSLAPAPDEPRPGYQRFSHYHEIEPIWLPRGRLGLALTEGPTSIQSPTRRGYLPSLQRAGTRAPWWMISDDAPRDQMASEAAITADKNVSE